MKMKRSKKQDKNTGQGKPLVWYEQGGERYTGQLALVVHSDVSPNYDIAYIDFPNHWKVALLSEINYIKQ
jgi:hypothetical protein